MLRLRRGEDRPLSGKLVIATLVGSASFRCLYGFLLLYFAFAPTHGLRALLTVLLLAGLAAAGINALRRQAAAESPG